MEPHGEQTEAAPTVEQYPSAQFAKVVAAVRDLQHPPQIGPYVIQELIGEGGMGSVYKAEQRQPIRRVVAVKVVKLGMDTREVVARFESERQALALMDHPNVAKVLDAGATDTGRPYFVMEYVKGEPITAFADRHKLTVRQRLELFTQACAAIQHAHQKAIIHRDLKPSNILVTVVDNQPVVKVIDFGVAKAVSQRLTERTLFTETGQLVGTPEYMAPEQAEGGALLDVDTRSDVYSLGVILYELLTGALPFEAKTLRSAGYNEIQRIIREVDPPRPSTRLSKLGKGGHEVARLRQTPLDSLERQLKSELEWIPLKAMHKDRSRRYASTIELSEDIGNYLSNKPLRAAPDSTGYRLRKFLRRNKTGVGA
jgi:serine/threonine protein kinase